MKPQHETSIRIVGPKIIFECVRHCLDPGPPVTIPAMANHFKIAKAFAILGAGVALVALLATIDTSPIEEFGRRAWLQVELMRGVVFMLVGTVPAWLVGFFFGEMAISRKSKWNEALKVEERPRRRRARAATPSEGV